MCLGSFHALGKGSWFLIDKILHYKPNDRILAIQGTNVTDITHTSEY